MPFDQSTNTSRPVVVVAGGVGAARFLCGLMQVVDHSDITAIVNTADDTQLHGLYISPDLDTVTYTVAGAIDPERGWGLQNESWVAMQALERYSVVKPIDSTAAPTWFNLGDKDLATHFYRTARLQEGATLTDVTSEIVKAWDINIAIKPMTNDVVRTMVTLKVDKSTISFQEYFVKHRHGLEVSEISFSGSDRARFSCVADLEDAGKIIIAPSNPIVSIGPIRALAGVDEILKSRRSDVVAVSPIVAGSALKGPADRLLAELGHEPSVVGVARLYAPICGTLVIDNADANYADAVRNEGMDCIVTNTIMSNAKASAALARTTLESTI